MSAVRASVADQQPQPRTRIAQTLAEYAAAFSFEAIPQRVRERAKYLMLDALGIAYASTRFDFAQRSFAAMAEMSSLDGRSARLIANPRSTITVIRCTCGSRARPTSLPPKSVGAATGAPAI
jgi:hypothetical protein